MFNFAREQAVLDLGGISIGGQPGELPTVLFGTLFYGKRYTHLTDEVKAIGREQIELQARISAMTGNPGIVDLFIPDEESLRPRIDLLLDTLDGRTPFSVDIPEADVRIKALEYLDSRDALGRTIYNSLNLGLTSREIEALGDHTPMCAIALAFNPKDFSTDGRLDILESGGGILEKGLLEIAKDIGIKNILIDTGATPFEHNAAETIRAIPVARNRWGLPAGCAIHNTVESWLWMKRYRREERANRDVYRLCDAGANALPVQVGASFSVYGPLRSAPMVFPFVAMVDKFISEGAQDYFGVACSDEHPRRRLE